MSESVTERIKKAGKTLGVSPREIAEEISRFVDNDNRNGLLEMFEVYLEWETTGTPTREIPEVTRERSLENLYVVAQLADCVSIAGGDWDKAFCITYNNNRNIAGQAAVFFKDVLGYEPPVFDQP